MKSCSTHEVSLYIGSVRGYNGEPFTREELFEAIAGYQVAKGDATLAVRITPTTFVVRDYVEDGWEVTAINYPRYIKKPGDIDQFMVGLANCLLITFRQNRISVVGSETTILIEAPNPEQHPAPK